MKLYLPLINKIHVKPCLYRKIPRHCRGIFLAVRGRLVAAATSATVVSATAAIVVAQTAKAVSAATEEKDEDKYPTTAISAKTSTTIHNQLPPLISAYTVYYVAT